MGQMQRILGFRHFLTNSGTPPVRAAHRPPPRAAEHGGPLPGPTPALSHFRIRMIVHGVTAISPEQGSAGEMATSIRGILEVRGLRSDTSVVLVGKRRNEIATKWVKRP